MQSFYLLILLVIGSLFSIHAFAIESIEGNTKQQPLLIVTDSWPPFVIDEDRGISGTDVDITRQVFKQMGIAINIKIVPWKRSIAMVKHKNADAILDISLTDRRKEFIYYPEHPVSEGTTVLFTRADKEFNFQNIAALQAKRTGAMLGYNYCDELDNAEFIKKAERVATLEQNFKKLMAKRLDMAVEVDSVGLYTAKKMRLEDKVAIIPNANFCKSGSYLGFSKKEGNRQLADEFSDILRQFKHTENYKLILEKYGL